MLVQFGQTRVKNNQTLPLQVALQPLSMSFSGDESKLYTVLFYDLSSPEGTYMHYQISNIKGGDIANGDLIFTYQPPNPPPNTGVHTYVIEVDEQGRRLPSGENEGGRAPVPLEALRRIAQLTPVAHVTFQVPSLGSFVGPITRSRAAFTVGQNCGCGHKPQPVQTIGHNCGCGRKPQPMIFGANNSNKDWFLPDAPLSDADRSYCRCTIEVAGKQPPECNVGRGGQGCVNPYAVCHSSVQGEGGFPDCTRYFDFSKIPDPELRGYVSSHKLPFSPSYDRSVMIQQLEDWRTQKEDRLASLGVRPF